mmetsp:Transcript_35367/g.36025  ORF Transcript_35367/g.36025 Transcript_35367/m.36025 type:complete len:140 (+) Transcript_35367:157-576(+)|eukprot:CAMPEP_0182420608 /NCGR_PEP_ID=MMETSP1167-20130531/5526_1 /TAXON_ID=2988 /ORGANISM="Mallomonas Sp, Strain CCMP3275" /LENGTH=139 /DNA_ID=CAMNT_0024596779 /DNA_START=119 /DNA_END=538 /DNA_ORIENTATION=-
MNIYRINLSKVEGRRSFPQFLSLAFHSTRRILGIEEFFDPKKVKASDAMVTGRGWTAADLRRKNFEDLHKLWYVLYKERNLLLTAKEKGRRNQRPILPSDEARYMKVKRSMASIKLVLGERKKIDSLLRAVVSSEKVQV